MKRISLAEGITRILYDASEPSPAAPIVFAAGDAEFLRQTACRFTPRPVYRFGAADGQSETKQTANGEVTVFHASEKRLERMSRSAELCFAYSGEQLLTGLGQHEDGVYDYSAQDELLYQHNMKIALPFVLSSAGYGVLIEADCAMRFHGESGGFRFALDAAEAFSYVVIHGADCADVVRKLTALVGRAAMLPKWAFGYMQSKERYQSADELVAVTDEFRRRKLGLDCVVLDWMSWQDGCWGDKTPDPARFPDVSALTEALHARNARLMVSVWPNMSKGDDHDAFEAQGMFLPGSNIYDAFSPAARELYWRQCQRYWMSGGVDALWGDSCEPFTDPDWCGAEKRPPEERYRLVVEASERSIDPVRLNAYGRAHCAGLVEHWREEIPDKRATILARSGGMDSSALGVILWSGDVCASWQVLRQQIVEGVKIAACGISYWTLDIGAFFVEQKPMWFWKGDYPAGVDDPAYRELYVRWFQYGCMLPVFRSHGTDTPREPWRFGGEDSDEYQSLQRAIRLRYRLLPYVYATAAQARRDGLPMLRGLLVAFGADERARAISDSYLLGDALLVKPVTRALSDGGAQTEVYLPEGADWFELFSLRWYAGGQTVALDTPLDRFPVLIRAGSILPVAEGVEYTAALPFPARELWVFCGRDGAFDLYDDAGDGYGYERGEYALIPLRYNESSRTLAIGPKQGSLPVDCELRVRFVRGDGTQSVCAARYIGDALSVRCPDEAAAPEALL